MIEKEELELRLANTEKALMALHTLTFDLLPPSYQEATGQMMEDYFHANKGLNKDCFDNLFVGEDKY